MKPTIRSLAEYRGLQCLNCETPLDVADKYCHQCGQLNSTKRLALKDFFSEFFANIISYDSKVWRSINHILVKPGFVTEQYCAGKRASYTNPFRFFLTVSIAFFLMLQVALQFSDTSNLKTTVNDNNSSAFDISVDSTINDKADIIQLIKAKQDSLGNNQNIYQKIALEKAIEELEKDTTQFTSKHEYNSQEELDKMDFINRYIEQISDYNHYYEAHPTATAQDALRILNHRIDNVNVTRFKKAKRFKSVINDPIAIINIILPKIPLFLFFFAPVISLFFWLVYARGKWNYMEHMVFNFHLFTFIFLMLYLVIAEKSIFGTSIVAMLLFGLLGPFYFYKAMRKFYKQGRFKTILKFLFINFVFFVLIILSSTLFITGSIFLSL